MNSASLKRFRKSTNPEFSRFVLHMLTLSFLILSTIDLFYGLLIPPRQNVDFQKILQSKNSQAPVYLKKAESGSEFFIYRKRPVESLYTVISQPDSIRIFLLHCIEISAAPFYFFHKKPFYLFSRPPPF